MKKKSTDSNFTKVNRYERIPVEIFPDSDSASRFVAETIAEEIKEKQSRKEMCVLGLATGSSPLSVYEELVRMHREDVLSFRNVVSFNLDEYYAITPESPQSYVRFMNENLFDHIDILPENIHIPDGTVPKEQVIDYCRQYEEQIEKIGGIDLQLLGIGRTGHIGFNEPGSLPDSVTRLITLDHVTVMDAASDFYGEENVPSQAITMGVGTIMRSRKIVLLAWGEGKAHVISRSVEEGIQESLPATYLQEHDNTLFVVDEASAAQLTRRKTPWKVGPCDWEDETMIRKAVVWLCQEVDKPVLKLTNRDYIDNGMYDLIASRGDAYSINIKIFNEIQHTITGWPGGKPDTDDSKRPERAAPFPKRVAVFSPHPDDDVISMGGTLIRLVDQGHEVHVAYQTSGNIAVFDDDVVRYTDFVQDFNHEFGIDNAGAEAVHAAITDFLIEKKPAQSDTGEILAIKTLIRKGEAKSACRYVGLPAGNVHFLNLPFYETGLITKKNLSKTDISIVADFLQDIKPHQIYAAGDLSDPHGTHRVCFTAILEAIKKLENEPWLKECYVWLYRGAWQEWDINDVDMAVPLSPAELSRKRSAIFKHQSQKDRPLFPGVDTREFWQRAEARTRDTARLYDALGMAEYEAMEVFKRLTL